MDLSAAGLVKVFPFFFQRSAKIQSLAEFSFRFDINAPPVHDALPWASDSQCIQFHFHLPLVLLTNDRTKFGLSGSAFDYLVFATRID